MKIPVGDQGLRVAQTVGGARAPAGAFGVGGVGGAGEGIVRAAAAEGQRELHEQDRAKREREHEVKQLEEQGRRNRAGAAFAGYQVALENFSTDISTRLSEGQVTRELANEEYTKGLADLKKTHLAQLDPRSREDFADNLILFDGRASARFQDGVRKNLHRERAGSFTTMTESLERLAATDRPGAVRQAEAAYKTEGTALYGADVATKQMQGFRERVAFTDWSNRILNGRRDARALSQVMTDIQKDADLDPDKRTVLVGRAEGFRQSVLSEAERAASSRERTLRSMIDARDKTILAGFTPNAEQDAAMLTAAKGTPYEPVVQAQVKFAAQTAQFSAMPPRQQETFANQFEATVRRNPTPDGQKTLEAYRTIMKNQQELVRDDPISFAAQRGTSVQPIDFSQIDTLKDQLQARVSVSRGIQAQYGAPLKVLTKEETRMLGEFLSKGTSDDRTKLLGALKASMPDAEAYNATMSQIAPDSPVTAWAGSLMNRRPIVDRNLVRPDVVTQGTQASQLLLRGERILNPTPGDKKQDGHGGQFKLPAEKDMRAGFEAVMGDSYRTRPDAHSIGFQSTKAVYAALSADEGDYSGEFKAGRWDKAVTLATGGASNFNGAKVVRPYGVNDSEFKNSVYAEIGRLVKTGQVGLTQPQLQRLQLESAGDARYLMRSGTGYLLDKRGQPVVIDLMESSTVTDTSKIPGQLPQ